MYQASNVEHLLRAIMGIRAHPRLTIGKTSLGHHGTQSLGCAGQTVRLLLEQGPIPPSDPTEIIERSQKATRISDKIKQYLDVFASEVAKGAGGEIGKRLVQVPIWMAVYHGIDRVTQALAAWIGTLPH
jgi:hypothetical protein